MGYVLGINTNRRPYEAPLATNQEDFQTFIGTEAIGARQAREPKLRLAGDAFNLNLQSSGDIPLLRTPYVGGAELRNLDSSIPVPFASF